MTDVKQRAGEVLGRYADRPVANADLYLLSRDLLEEIERLEASHAARQVEALARIARALEQAAMYGWGGVGSEQR